MRDLPLRELSTTPIQEHMVPVNRPLPRVASTCHDTPPTIHFPRPIARNDTAAQLRIMEEQVEIFDELCSSRRLGTVQHQHSPQTDDGAWWPSTNPIRLSDLVPTTAQISSISHTPGYPLRMAHDHRLSYAQQTSTESSAPSTPNSPLSHFVSWAEWVEKRGKGYGYPCTDSQRSSPSHEPVEFPPPPRLRPKTKSKTETARTVSSGGTDTGLASDSRSGAEGHAPDHLTNKCVGVEPHGRYVQEGHWIARSIPGSSLHYRFPSHSRYMNFAESSSVLHMVGAILNNRKEYEALLKVPQTLAQSLLDLFQIVSLRTDITPRLRSCVFKAMLRLSKASGQCPSLLAIDNFQKEGDKPFASGGFCDIWKGHVGMEPVCLKIVRVYRDSDMERILKDSMHEAIIWRQLEHPNLLPFHGLYLQEHRICLISPWAANGSLTHYLDSTNIEHVNHEALIWDIANGLGYLHSRKIVHADLKGDNILITSHGRACIADFGLSRLTDSQVLVMTSTRTLAGTLRWTAPEILTGEGQHTYRSDVYAFGCVCYEVYSHLRPFHDLRSDGAVILQVHLGKRPSRPDNTKLTDRIWSFIETCWATDPLQRPEPQWLIRMLECLLTLEGKDIPLSAPKWDHARLSASIWSKLQQCNFDWTGVEDYLSRSASRVSGC